MGFPIILEDAAEAFDPLVDPLFHVPFMSIDDHVHHLVGFKEQPEGKDHAASDTDTTTAPAEESSSSKPKESSSMASIPEGLAGPEVCLTDTIAVSLEAELRPEDRQPRLVQSRNSRSSRSSSRTRASITNAMQADVYVDSDLSVKYTSVDFEAKYGTPETIAEMIPEPEPFRQWLHSVVDDIFSGVRLPKIEEYGNLTIRSGGETDTGSGEMWRIKVNFPSPSRYAAPGDALPHGDRSSYSVSIRLAKPRRAGSGTAASTEHGALGGAGVRPRAVSALNVSL